MSTDPGASNDDASAGAAPAADPIQSDVNESAEASEPHQHRSKATQSKNPSQITREDVFHFAHRLGIFAAAMVYVVTCLSSTPDTIKLLRGHENARIMHTPDSSDTMRNYIGTTTIRQSPLLVSALNDVTDPVFGTLYLTTTGHSFSPCEGMNPGLQLLYGDLYLRKFYHSIVSSVAYNLTFLDASESELIAPVVDCTITGITKADTTLIQSFYLMRKTQDPENVYILTVKMSNMEYTLPDQNEGGPAGVASLSFINDLQVDAVEHHVIVSIGFPFEKLDFRVYEQRGLNDEGMWALKTIPKDPDNELAKNLFAAARSGFYIRSESEQSNINNELWLLDTNPADAIAQMHFASVALLRDSWAWVHVVEFWLGFDVLINLFILLVVSYHNLLNGTLWMGDSFVAVSSTLLVRGGLVILTWYVDKMWAIIEFCMHDAGDVAGTQTIVIYESIARADLMSLYLCVSGVIGMLFRERVDPLYAVISFEIGYGYRQEMLTWFPSVSKTVQEYAHKVYTFSTQAAMTGQENITPMEFRTTYAITSSSAVISAVLGPIMWSLSLIVLYIIAVKIYWRVYPEKLLILRSRNTANTGKSDNEEALLAQKRQYTLFEVATGAQLENRFGLMSHYITCVFLKGTKYASADGIYSNGFVIANGKFLVQARDIWWIVLMKAVQARIANIYVYELKGNSVQQKARLVYPETLTWMDIVRINITILT